MQSEKTPVLYGGITDYLLLFLENLLAIRVVFSYLGSQDTLVHRISEYLLFPLRPLISSTTLISDSSRFELLTALLVFILFYIHKALDVQRSAKEVK